MEGQRHNNPLNPRCFCLQRPKKDGTIAPNPHYSGKTKALGGSFKLVTLALKNCKGDDSTAPGNTKEWGHNKFFRPITWQVLIT